jgi:hypothetical protein
VAARGRRVKADRDGPRLAGGQRVVAASGNNGKRLARLAYGTGQGADPRVRDREALVLEGSVGLHGAEVEIEGGHRAGQRGIGHAGKAHRPATVAHDDLAGRLTRLVGTESNRDATQLSRTETVGSAAGDDRELVRIHRDGARQLSAADVAQAEGAVDKCAVGGDAAEIETAFENLARRGSRGGVLEVDLVAAGGKKYQAQSEPEEEYAGEVVGPGTAHARSIPADRPNVNNRVHNEAEFDYATRLN